MRQGGPRQNTDGGYWHVPLRKPQGLCTTQQSRLNYKRRVYSDHTKGTLKCPAWVIGEAVLALGRVDPKDTYYIRPHYQHMESKQLYLIHRNKHREAAKMRRQRNMAQMKEQIKTPEKELNKREITNLSDAESKTLYKDAQGT